MLHTGLALAEAVTAGYTEARPCLGQHEAASLLAVLESSTLRRDPAETQALLLVLLQRQKAGDECSGPVLRAVPYTTPDDKTMSETLSWSVAQFDCQLCDVRLDNPASSFEVPYDSLHSLHQLPLAPLQ